MYIYIYIYIHLFSCNLQLTRQEARDIHKGNLQVPKMVSGIPSDFRRIAIPNHVCIHPFWERVKRPFSLAHSSLLTRDQFSEEKSFCKEEEENSFCEEKDMCAHSFLLFLSFSLILTHANTHTHNLAFPSALFANLISRSNKLTRGILKQSQNLTNRAPLTCNEYESVWARDWEGTRGKEKERDKSGRRGKREVPKKRGKESARTERWKESPGERRDQRERKKRTCKPTRANTRARTRTCTSIRTRTRTRARTCAHTHTHTHAHTHTHTHAHVQSKTEREQDSEQVQKMERE